MESASKALIMAASILFGMMIIAIGVFLFNLHSDYSSNMYKQMEETEIAKFNVQFTKYYGSNTNDEGVEEPILCTMHDIITVANIAQQNNKNYNLNSMKGFNITTEYVQVKVKVNKKWENNFEKLSDDSKISFIKKYSTTSNGKNIKYYKCTSVIISSVTKKVCCIAFQEI